MINARQVKGIVSQWNQIPATSFTAAPELIVVEELTFTFAASTSITASADCSSAVGVGEYIFNSTDDTRTSAQQVTAISADGLTITLGSAYAGTTGASKAATIFGYKLTMGVDLSSEILKNSPLRYTIGGTEYFGICSSIGSNYITICGPVMGGNVTNLKYGDSSKVVQFQVTIPSTYEDASNTDLIQSDLKSNFLWDAPKAYLVRFGVYSDVEDTSDDGQASVRINNTEVNMITGGATIKAAKTWYNTVVNIAPTAYDINPGEELEVTCIKGTGGDAQNLSVKMIFVTP